MPPRNSAGRPWIHARSWYALRMKRYSLALLIALTLAAASTTAHSFADDQPADTTTNPAVDPQPRPDEWWTQRNDSFNARAKQGHEQGDIGVIFLGDSITQGWEVAGKDVWAANYAKRNAVNFGIGGDRTQHVLWRIKNGNLEGLANPKQGNAPKLVVLMIGTNNIGADSREQIADGVIAIVRELQLQLPKTRILVLGVFPRSELPPDQYRAAAVEINRWLAYKLRSFSNTTYLDISDAFFTNATDAKHVANGNFADIVNWTLAQGEDLEMTDAHAQRLGIDNGTVIATKRLRILRDKEDLSVTVTTSLENNVAVVRRRGADERIELFVTSLDDGTLIRAVTGLRSQMSDTPNERVAQSFDNAKQFWFDEYQRQTLTKAIMPDMLHLSPAGYQRWADAMEPTLRSLLGEPPLAKNE